MADRDLTTQYLKIYPRLKTETQDFSNATSGEYVYFFSEVMLPRFRDIEGSTCPNNNFDQCPQIKKSDEKLHFSNVHNFFTIRDNELIFFTGQQ